MKGERGVGLLRALKLDRADGALIVDTARDWSPEGMLLNSPRADLLRFMPALNVTEDEIKLMLERLEQIARQRNTQKLVLMCGPRQPEALRLYEQSGYARRNAYGKHHDHPLSIFFEKHL